MTHTPSSLPVGGTTGLDHTSSVAIDDAANWFASQSTRLSPLVPVMRSRFALSALDACVAIREARSRL